MKKKVFVLDCTCRDGGYYSLWNFDIKKINDYLLACSNSKINIVEIGFIFPENKDLGEFAYCNDSLFKKLKIPKNLKLSVMINAKDFFDNKKDLIKSKIQKYFKHSKDNKFQMVRVAINFNNFLNAKNILDELKSLGYKTGLNLMQSHEKTEKKIYNLCKKINQWKNIDILYFADSLGSMNPDYVKLLFQNTKKFWKKDLGIHAHNNKTYALYNTMIALKYGAKYLDCTILGMGRGAGNTCTEHLLIELKKLNYNFKPIFLSNTFEYFQYLKNKYNWGPSFFYHEASTKKIHPTYIQRLLSDNKYSLDKVNFIIDNLSKNKSEFFKKDFLDNQIYKLDKTLSTQNVKNYFINKKILILGSGPKGGKLYKKIISFIKKEKPVVISLNINPFIKKKYINYYACCYDFRVFFEFLEMLKNNKPIIFPANKFEDFLNLKLKNKMIINYDLIVKKNKFLAMNNYCVLDKPLALAYVLAFCLVSNPKKIFLAFIDQYFSKEKEGEYIRKLAKKFKKNSNIDLKFI